MLPRRSKSRVSRLAKGSDGSGPGLLFMLVALVAVAVAGARLLGFGPDFSSDTAPTSGMISVGVSTVSPEGASSGTNEPEAPQAPDEGASPTAATAPDRLADSGARRATVLVYHAHATENYGPAATHQTDGRSGHVVEVGRVFSDTLQNLGVQAVHDTAVHDHPRWSEAFPNAALTVNALMREQEEVSALFDIHRDAIERDVGKEATTANVDGRSVARILLVIGDQNNPYADSNAEFAETLKTKMDQMYPGLSRGIRIQRSDYNGRLHPNSVQVFIGDHRYNTVEEAEEAARLFAQVVSAVFE